MTNLEKIDFAVLTTLGAHPDYSEIMTEILTKKLLDKDPFVTAKYFSRANDARAHMMEVSDLDLLSEVIKNAVKTSFLLEQKGIATIGDATYLDGEKDKTLFGSTACKWISNELEKYPKKSLDDILERHPEILPILVSVFEETRYGTDSVITKEELDNPDLIHSLFSVLNRIENDIHSYTEA